MRYRVLGNTGLQVSEIGLGAEWLERHTGRNGSSKGISAPPGRRGSMSVPGTCPR